MNDQLVRVDEDRSGGDVVVRLSGEIDLSNVDRVGQQLDAAIEGCTRVVVDLSAIEYIDSQGLRLLSRLANKLAEQDATLEVVAPPDGVARDVLELTRMSDDIPVRDALDS
jgi:anti-anti-sigma factor